MSLASAVTYWIRRSRQPPLKLHRCTIMNPRTSAEANLAWQEALEALQRPHLMLQALKLHQACKTTTKKNWTTLKPTFGTTHWEDFWLKSPTTIVKELKRFLRIYSHTHWRYFKLEHFIYLLTSSTLNWI